MNLPIIPKRNYFFLVSGILTLASLVLLFVYGLKPGLDFTGGTLLEIQFTGQRPEVTQVQEKIAEKNLGSVIVQPVGEDGMLLKMRFIAEEEHQDVLAHLRNAFEKTGEQEQKLVEERVESIGPSIGAELKSKAIKTGIFVALAIIVYIAYSFRKVAKPVQSWKYGVAAVVALFHNVIITVGVFVLLGKFKGVEVDIPFVVALLTILGASVNDTIVVFDRIREKLIRRGTSNFAETVNVAVNETVGRSVNIPLAIALTLVSLLLFGGDSIHYFSLALLVGIVAGTYSSIFLASPILVAWHELEEKRRRH